MSRHPLTKWAQRSDKVFITIELPDAKDVKLTLQPDGHFYFSANSGPEKIPYEVDFVLLDKISVEESKEAINPRHICYLVKKSEKKWWSRLLKPEGKPPVYLKVDWDKWIDEDDEKESKFGDMDFGGDMDFSKLDMGDEEDDFDGDADKANEDVEMEGTSNIEDENKAEESQPASTSTESEAKA